MYQLGMTVFFFQFKRVEGIMPRRRLPRRNGESSPYESRRQTSTVRYYHYTTRTNLDSILRDMVIRPSLDPRLDTSMGTGVYLTPRPPHTSDAELSLNNYDASRRGVNDPRLESYISFSAKELRPYIRRGVFQCTDAIRAICVFRARIHLNDFDFKTGDRALFGQS